jgi:hypothetical protein
MSGALLAAVCAWLLGGFTEPLGSTIPVILLVAATIFVLLVKRGPLKGRFSLPENRRQIPAEILGGSVVRGAWRFGFEMGTGVRTYVPSAAPYLLLLGIVLARPMLAAALLAGCGFAIGRAVPLVVRMGLSATNERPAGVLLRPSLYYEPAGLLIVVVTGVLLLSWT